MGISEFTLRISEASVKPSFFGIITMYKIGKFTFDTQKQTLIIGDKITKLTTKESELLSLLCAHVNEILERNYGFPRRA